MWRTSSFSLYLTRTLSYMQNLFLKLRDPTSSLSVNVPPWTLPPCYLSEMLLTKIRLIMRELSHRSGTNMSFNVYVTPIQCESKTNSAVLPVILSLLNPPLLQLHSNKLPFHNATSGLHTGVPHGTMPQILLLSGKLSTRHPSSSDSNIGRKSIPLLTMTTHSPQLHVRYVCGNALDVT